MLHLPTKAVITATLQKYGPAMMVSAGIAGLLYSNVLTHKATLEAEDILEELHKKQKEEGVNLTRKEAKWEDIKAVYKVYAPAVVLSAVSGVMVAGGFGIVSKRLTIASTTAEIATEGLRTYREKVAERFGQEEEREVRNSIVKDSADKVDIPEGLENPATGVPGKQLFFDSGSKRYFYSTREEIRKAEITVNDRLTFETFVSIDEFYDILDNDDLPPLNNIMGERYGFDVDKCTRMDIRFDCFMSKFEVPCTSVVYDLYEKPVRR